MRLLSGFGKELFRAFCRHTVAFCHEICPPGGLVKGSLAPLFEFRHRFGVMGHIENKEYNMPGEDVKRLFEAESGPPVVLLEAR